MISAGYKKLGRYFFTGLLAILPLALTLAIAAWAIGFVGRIIGPETFPGKLLQRAVPFVSNQTLAYIVGWAFVLGAIFLLGILLESGAKRYFQSRFDALVKRVPVVGNVYETSRQLVQMLDSKSESEMKKMQVVFCFFGRETGAAFLALMPTPERFHIGGVDYHAIIIPSARCRSAAA